MEKIIITNKDGESISIGNQAPYFLEVLDGAFNIPVTIENQKSPKEDGSTYIDNTLESRAITIEGMIITRNNPKELLVYKRKIQKVLNPKLGEVVITYSYNGILYFNYILYNHSKIKECYIIFICIKIVLVLIYWIEQTNTNKGDEIMVHGFTKITPVNGFDAANLDNAKQNNYAWSMQYTDEYLYVGTGRNIFYNVFKGIVESIGVDIKFPDILIPENQDDRAEIWRYKKDGSEQWKRVFKAHEGIEGFRFMINYTSIQGENALYAAGSSTYNVEEDGASVPKVSIFKSTNGYDWELLESDIPGTSTRSMVVHGDKLYMSVLNELSQETGTRIYASRDPEYEGWQLVTEEGNPDKNPNNGVVAMESFNGHIYAGTGGPEGFELWRTKAFEPGQDRWIRVIDKGAGDALNQGPLTLGVFKDHLYIGVIYSPFDVNLRYGSFKPFDLIRIDKKDRWEVVVGGTAFEPTSPETGTRKPAISELPSGFGNPFNLYCWQLQEHEGELYLGTFDWLVLVVPMLLANISLLTEDTSLVDLMEQVLRYIPEQFLSTVIGPNFSIFRGFDLFKTKDAVNWTPVSINGLNNPYNYGVRKLLSSEDGHLYLGTANVFEGLEIWKK